MISVSKLCSYYFPFDKATVLAKLSEKRGIPESEIQKEWDKSRDDGIAMHKQIESFMIRQKHSRAGLLPIEVGIEGYCNFIHTAIRDWGYEIFGAEMKYENTQFGVIGKLDALFRKDEHLLIVDWKSNTGHFEKESCQAPLQEFFRDKHHQYIYQLLIQSFLAEGALKLPTALAYVTQNGRDFSVEYTNSNHELVIASIEEYLRGSASL